MDPFYEPSCIQNCVNEYDLCLEDRVVPADDHLEVVIQAMFCAIVAELCVADYLVPA